uniref:Uncharacterized protein n=1 Tax=Siphoviridae sp. ct2D011 TaxID=2825314 RepID=A0A8S5V966_9CAUD|nr:MAG TPA: hypothetical protein [Siphoviridae sp. ct2D011]
MNCLCFHIEMRLYLLPTCRRRLPFRFYLKSTPTVG